MTHIIAWPPRLTEGEWEVLAARGLNDARELGKRTSEARSQTAGHSSPIEDTLQDATQADWTEWLEFGGYW